MKSTECGLYCFGLLYFVSRWKKSKDVPLEFERGDELFEACNDYINLFETNGNKNDKILMKYLQTFS